MIKSSSKTRKIRKQHNKHVKQSLQITNRLHQISCAEQMNSCTGYNGIEAKQKAKNTRWRTQLHW